MRKKKSKVTTFGLIFIFAICLILPGAGILVCGNRTFSPMENRLLTGRPSFTWDAFSDGSFQSKTEDYAADQIPGRDLMVKTANEICLLCGERKFGDTCLGEEGRYFEVPDLTGMEKQILKNLSRIRNFLDCYPDMDAKILFVPNSAISLSEEVPVEDESGLKDFLPEETAELFGDVFCDLREAFAGRDDYYYKTDHHWTLEGAYRAYRIYCEELGPVPMELSDFHMYEAEYGFYGSLYSNAPCFGIAGDEFYYCTGICAEEVLVGDREGSLFDSTKLSEKDKYAYFFGGNYPVVTIHTGTENGKSLLVVKNSFANSFVPFLMKNYETVVMVDPRYYNESMEELEEKENFTDFLLLYDYYSFARIQL